MSARIIELDALRMIKRHRKAIVGLIQNLLAFRHEAVIHDISLYDGIIHKFHFFHSSSIHPPCCSANALSQHPPARAFLPRCVARLS